MKVEESHIMNILYSPITYIHSDNLLAISSSIDMLSDEIINHLIIKQYQLEHLPDLWQPDDITSTLLLNHWQMIPTVATLIGGYLLREQLIIDKMTLINDPKLLAFISLPLRHTVCISRVHYITDYSIWGEEFITCLTHHLPAALRQRLALCFSNDIHLKKPFIANTPDNINLLRMAINYAHDTSKSLTA